VDPKVSIIIPAYQLEKCIDLTVRRVSTLLDKMGLDYEIIVVDDGSSDNTWMKAMNACNNGRVKVLRYSVNRGKGYALLYGFKHSHGDHVVFFDGDLDIHEGQIMVLLNGLKEADCVITSKWHPASKTIASPIRKLLSKSFNLLTRLLIGIRFKDTQTGGKAFRRKVLEDIVPLLTVKRYAFDVELLVAITARHYRIVEVPNIYPIILKSKFKIREILRMFLELLAVAYRKARGRYMLGCC
jgi:glycosyltransferase involved in cell wall biosynthesis